jgi:hypothetical protein
MNCVAGQRSDIQVKKKKYYLLWRRNQLLVKAADYNKQNGYICELEEKQDLINCLRNSHINLIRIDPQLGIEQLLFWINACQEANKPIYLCIPKQYTNNQLLNILQLLINSLLACILITLLIPLTITVLIWMQFNYYQLTTTYIWYVGQRGRLFKLIKLTTNNGIVNTRMDYKVDITQMIYKYTFEIIPGLLNVIRGKMTLFGSTSYSLKEAINLSYLDQKYLNKIPSLFGYLFK